MAKLSDRSTGGVCLRRFLFGLLVLVLPLTGCGARQAARPKPPAVHERTKAAPAARTVQGFTLKYLASLPAGTDGLASATLGQTAYLFGGLTNSGSTASIRALKGTSLRPAGSLPLALHDLAAAPQEGSIVVAGGGEVQSSPAVFRYDPASGAIHRTATLPTPLSDLAAATLGQDVYLFGGYTGKRFSDAIYRLGPDQRVTRAASLPAGVRYMGAAALSGSVYLFGGITQGGYQSAIYRFTPGGAPTRVGALPQAVRAPLVAAGSGGILIVGGETAPGKDAPGVYWYTGQGGPRSIGQLPRPLGYGTLSYLGQDRFLIAGGEDGAVRASGLYLLQLQR